MGDNATLMGCAPTTLPAPPPNGFIAAKYYTEDEVRQLVAALEEPFDLTEIKWRVTNTTADRRRGQVLAYADPRAYADRLNLLVTVRGWTREYSVQTINNIERKMSNGSQIAGKVVVTCRLTIHGLGTNSGIGEEWADNENAGTAAEAQAFKRACSCFGLGRYLYDIEGCWVDLDGRRQPTAIPKLPSWAIPEKQGSSGVRERSKHPAEINGSSPQANSAPQETGALLARVRKLCGEVGFSLSRSAMLAVANVDAPEQVPPARLGAARRQARGHASRNRARSGGDSYRRTAEILAALPATQFSE